MNKHRKGLYIISGLFYLFFSGALALYPTKMTVGATISMIAGAVLTLAAAVSSFILAAQSGKNPKDSAVRTVVMPICFVGFAVILAADIINTAVHFETAFDAVRIIAELIGAAGHIAAAVIMFKNNMVFIRRNKIAYAVFAAMTGNPASIFVSGAFARERADGECKKLRKAGVIELIVGAVIIVAAYIITNLTLPSDTFRAVTDWLFLCLTLVTDMGLALIAVSTPKDKKKKAKKKMNRRNILLYTLAGVFSVIGALTNGISPFLAGSPAAEKIVSLCLAIILILIGVSAITASSRIKKSGNADLRLTEKIMPALLCVMAIFILVDAAVCIPNFNGLTSGVRIAGDIINAIGFASCGILMLKNGRSEKNTVLYIILSVLSGSVSPIMITAAWLALPYDPDRERSRRKARNGLIIAFFVVLVTYAAVYIALGQETAQNIGLSELYIKVMSALFVAVIAVFAFIPSSKYKRRDSAEK